MSESYKDDIPDLGPGATVALKIERTLFAFLYCVMLTVACTNVWNYLVKKKMYKSYPMTAAYSVLIIYSIISIAYELFMSIACGDHDCLSAIYTIDESESDNEEYRTTHWEAIVAIGRFWRIRQQMAWSMGML